MQPSKIDTLLNTMDSTSVNQPPKRKLLLSLGVSLSKEAQSKIQKLPGELCKHGNKLCSKKGMSLQCEVYYNWVHASCEGVSNDDYKLFNKLSAAVPNIVYCCNLNQCYACLNQLTSVANNLTFDNVEQTFQAITVNHDALKDSFSKLRTRANTALERHFKDLLK